MSVWLAKQALQLFFELMQVWHNTPVFLDHSVSFIMFCKTRTSFIHWNCTHIYGSIWSSSSMSLVKDRKAPARFFFYYYFLIHVVSWESTKLFCVWLAKSSLSGLPNWLCRSTCIIVSIIFLPSLSVYTLMLLLLSGAINITHAFIHNMRALKCNTAWETVNNKKKIESQKTHLHLIFMFISFLETLKANEWENHISLTAATQKVSVGP